MNRNRIIQIIFSDLGLENLKLTESMENAINSNEHTVDEKLVIVKKLLGDICLNELMIAKFQSLINQQKTDDTTTTK